MGVMFERWSCELVGRRSGSHGEAIATIRRAVEDRCGLVAGIRVEVRERVICLTGDKAEVRVTNDFSLGCNA